MFSRKFLAECQLQGERKRLTKVSQGMPQVAVATLSAILASSLDLRCKTLSFVSFMQVLDKRSTLGYTNRRSIVNSRVFRMYYVLN